MTDDPADTADSDEAPLPDNLPDDVPVGNPEEDKDGQEPEEDKDA